MSKKLINLEILFENLESFTIQPECVKHFYVSDFKKHMFFQSPDDVFEHDSAEFAKLIVTAFDKIPGSMMCGHELGYSFESRIMAYRDISSLIFNFEDGNSLDISVWGGDSDYTNAKQWVKIKNGVAYMMFCKDKPEDWDEEVAS